jgi:hypothetical protein
MFPVNPATLGPALSIQNLSYPAAIWTCTATLKRVHSIWRLVTQGNLYADPDNFFGWISGITLQALIRDNVLLEYSTVPFLFSSRFLDLFEQEESWNKSRIRSLEAFQCLQPVFNEFQVKEQASSFSFFSNVTLIWIKINPKNLNIRIQRIAYSTLDFAFHTFKLVMRVMDIVEIFSMEEKNLRSQSLRESGIHVPRCLPLLVDSIKREVFTQRLQNEKIGLINMGKIFKSQKTGGDLVAVENFFEFLHLGFTYYEIVSGVCKESSDALSSILKQKIIYKIYNLTPQFVQKILNKPKTQDWLKEKKRAQSPAVKLPPIELISFTLNNKKPGFTSPKTPDSIQKTRSPQKKQTPWNVYPKTTDTKNPLSVLTFMIDSMTSDNSA